MSRATPVRLSDHQRYAVYKYAVEKQCILQKGEAVIYRVQAQIIAEELNLLPNKIHEANISGHLVKESINKVIEWQYLLEKVPDPPKATVQLDMLSAENTRLSNHIEDVRKNNAANIAARDATIKALMDKIAKVKAAVSA